MGCWNKDGCTPGSPQSSVAAALSKEDPSLLLLLAGDNVYPDKVTVDGEKRKHYSTEKLRAGMDCLTSDRNLVAALGNHNIADPHILATELAEPRWFLPNRYYALRSDSNNTALIVLDSNMLEEPSLAAEARAMMNWLSEVLALFKRDGTTYSLMMHHPVASFKKNKIQMLERGDDLLEALETWPPIFLLVADTHNFQKGTLCKKSSKSPGVCVTQIVSGTGGADLDSLESLHRSSPSSPPSSSTIALGNGWIYRVQDAAVAYGYQRIHGTISEFIEVKH